MATNVQNRTSTATDTRTTWAIDPAHSTVEFAVKHMMFTTVKGRFAGITGEITFDHENLADSSVNVEIDATTIDTRDEKRDAHLRSPDFFDVEKYPTITFRSTRVEQGRGEDFRVFGDLTMHGVTREVELDVNQTGQGKNPWGVEVMGFEATTRVNRKDFGLEWNVALETGGVLVGEDIKITLDIQAGKQS